jgi:hypothetical protein
MGSAPPATARRARGYAVQRGYGASLLLRTVTMAMAMAVPRAAASLVFE